eukprot:9640114-Lingulodinium_polyedra.AAC.1
MACGGKQDLSGVGALAPLSGDLPVCGDAWSEQAPDDEEDNWPDAFWPWGASQDFGEYDEG